MSMARPKHRRCDVCGTVTARYAGSQDAGAFTVRRWVADPVAGEVLAVNGTVVRCREHAGAVVRDLERIADRLTRRGAPAEEIDAADAETERLHQEREAGPVRKPTHIPPGREQLWARAEQTDTEVERTSAAVDAAEAHRTGLANALGWDDPLVDDADRELDRRLTEHSKAVAVADRVHQERTAGLSWGIDHDPTAPVCAACEGKGCAACRGWGREYRTPIPVWDGQGERWVDPSTGRAVDLLDTPAPDPPCPDGWDHAGTATDCDTASGRGPNMPPPAAPIPPRRTAAAPTTTGATGMTNIIDARATILAAVEQGEQLAATLSQARDENTEAHGRFLVALEGSTQDGAVEVARLFQRADELIDEARQMIVAGNAAAAEVAARL